MLSKYFKCPVLLSNWYTTPAQNCKQSHAYRGCQRLICHCSNLPEYVLFSLHRAYSAICICHSSFTFHWSELSDFLLANVDIIITIICVITANYYPQSHTLTEFLLHLPCEFTVAFIFLPQLSRSGLFIHHTSVHLYSRNHRTIGIIAGTSLSCTECSVLLLNW